MKLFQLSSISRMVWHLVFDSVMVYCGVALVAAQLSNNERLKET